MGNYHSHEYIKFIPDFSKEMLFNILISNPLYSVPDELYKEVVDTLFPLVQEEIFKYKKPLIELEFPDRDGHSGYYSQNITE